MPAPRAVLNDIHDLKLDPKKVHRSTNKAGRLLTKIADEKKPVEKPGLVFVEKVEVPVAIEEKVSEEVANSEQVSQTAEETKPAEETQEKVLAQATTEKSKKKQQYQRKNSYNN